MIERQEAAAFCLTLPGSYEDYPFDDPNWTVMRHRGNRRMFAAIYERGGRIWLNLKCDPMWGDLWRRTYPSVVPAYHMNKKHWISVILDGTVPEETIRGMIEDSFDLTRPRLTNRKNDEETRS